jgi:hypothetical protein
MACLVHHPSFVAYVFRIAAETTLPVTRYLLDSRMCLDILIYVKV